MVNKMKCHEKVPDISSTSQGYGKYRVHSPLSLWGGLYVGPEGSLSINSEAHSLPPSPHCMACYLGHTQQVEDFAGEDKAPISFHSWFSLAEGFDMVLYL